MDTQFGMNRRGGSAGGSAGLRPALPQASGTTPKGKGFVIKSWEDSQKMGIVSGGGSHWSSNKKNKTGETASGNGKKASGGTEASSKPVEKPPETKPGSGSASSSKPNAGNAATTPKDSTTSKTNSGQSKPAKTGETPSENGKKASGGMGASSKSVEKPPESKSGSGSASSSKPSAGNAATTSKNNTTSKTKPEKSETPNEVNTWKPSTKKKDKGEPQGDTKPPKSPETNKPEENAKGTEGTGSSGTPPRYGERQISQEEYDMLRDQTPTQTLRDKVNEGHDKKTVTRDEVLPGKTFKGALEADHIVSMDRISKMDGFGKLSYAQKLEVLNNPDNFIGLSKSANTSKQSKSFEEWTHYKKGKKGEIEVNSEFREKMMVKEKELERKLQKQIDDFNSINNKGDD
ncbi:hypothetical protein AB4Z30_20515 [Paenibacillus sp. 2TAF8]|uniref:hypothetical protein n=1 Tax=Paenibacillus sp. 2TAF8 TaxID=3233020 RepID=UPI003F9C483A